MFLINCLHLIQGLKQKKNPEPELFSGGWGVAGVDTYTGLFGEQTNKKKHLKMIFLETT